MQTRLTLTALTGISLLSLLAACGASDGYYDANGNYIGNAPVSERKYNYRAERAIGGGYYEEERGYYTAVDTGLNIPLEMLPARGLCRVWFLERAVADQPPVESCNRIRSRVPAGAYIVYGG